MYNKWIEVWNLFRLGSLFTHSMSKGTKVETGSQPCCLFFTRYDEEQAQSENAERDLRGRSGQLLGSKGTKGTASARSAAATWKWGCATDSEWLPLPYCGLQTYCNKTRTTQTFLSQSSLHSSDCGTLLFKYGVISRVESASGLWLLVGNMFLILRIRILRYAWLSINCTWTWCVKMGAIIEADTEHERICLKKEVLWMQMVLKGNSLYAELEILNVYRVQNVFKCSLQRLYSVQNTLHTLLCFCF